MLYTFLVVFERHQCFLFLLIPKFNQKISKNSQIYTRKKKSNFFSISLLANVEISQEEKKTLKGTLYLS